MAAITADLQMEKLEELLQRKRVARMIVVGSASFTALIALVGGALEKHFPETAETEPEVVAHHYSEAKMAAPALRFWKRAGNRALERSANSEAIDHFRRVVELSKELDDHDVSLRAARQGLWVMPLSSCYVGRPVRRGFVLGFGGTDVRDIPGGIRRLSAVLRGRSREA